MLKWVHMDIKKINENSILLKGKKENVLINPSAEMIKDNKFQSRIFVFLSKDSGFVDLQDNKLMINGPGEYEVGGVEILGFKGGVSETLYTINMEGVLVCVVGDIEEALSDKRIEKIDNVDVLIVSIKDRKDVSNKMIIDWAKKWGVNYLIPINYNDEELKKALDDMDMEGLEPIDSLKVEKENLPDGMEVVVLK